MFLTGNATFMSFAVGTILVVAVAMLGSLTVLPAVLSKLGDRVEKGRIPFLAPAARRNDGESRVWTRSSTASCAGRSSRRSLAGGLLVALAIPALQHEHGKEPGSRACPRTCRSCRRTTGSRPRSRVARCRPWSSSRPTTSTDPAGRRGGARAARAGDRHRADERPGQRQRQRPRRRRRDHDPDGRQRHRRRARSRRSTTLREDLIPGTLGQVDGVERLRHRHDRRLGGLQRADEQHRADRLRVRPRARVRAPDGHLPLDRDRAEGDRAQPALRGRRLRRAGLGVPGRPPASRCWASSPTAGSSPGCRCSCSCSCSASRWTTTCSSSAGSGRRSTAA